MNTAPSSPRVWSFCTTSDQDTDPAASVVAALTGEMGRAELQAPCGSLTAPTSLPHISGLPLKPVWSR